MKKSLKILAAVLCCALIFSFGFEVAFVAYGSANHNCLGEDCHICQVAECCTEMLKTLLTATGFVAAIYFSDRIRDFLWHFREYARSVNNPVNNKVKLLN